MQKITSRFLSLDLPDWIRGLFIAVGAAVVAFMGESFDKGVFTLDFTTLWHTAVAAGLSYLTHCFFTPAKAVKSAQ
ncbi:MAG TPA: hypothetical protein VHA56_16120 [Mucilaginibacter sp.]|nr:hypothetical protein [Mucilaginibacter sp.]